MSMDFLSFDHLFAFFEMMMRFSPQHTKRGRASDSDLGQHRQLASQQPRLLIFFFGRGALSPAVTS